MKPDDHFERFDPPPLDEAALRRELERREQRRNTVLLAIAGALLQAVLAVLALLVMEFDPALALILVCFAIVSTAGSGAIAIVYAQKGVVSYVSHAN